MNRLAQFFCAALLVGTPLHAYALGLGRLVLKSGLDEPLNAQVEILSATPQELKSLNASLASRADFDLAGVERAHHLFDIKYSVIKQPDGRTYLAMTTDRPMREPYLHTLVQVEWTGGRLIREYSALLDPPGWVAGKPAAEPELPTTTEAPAPVAEAQVKAEEPVAPVAAAETPAVPDMGPAATETAKQPEAAPAEAKPADAAATEAKPTEVAPAAAVTAETPAPQPEATAPAKTETAAAPAASAETAPAPGEPRRLGPETAETAPAPAQPAPAPAEAVAPAPVAAEPASTPSLMAEGGAEWASRNSYGPVKEGDTLSQITNQVRVDRTLTAEQVMVAILRTNPQAFVDNNVNRLKTGKILKMPERSTVEAVSPALANKEFRAQFDAWQEYKLKLAASGRPVKMAASEELAPEPKIEKPKAEAKAAKPKADEKKGKKGAKVEPQAAAVAKAEPVDLLRIVRSTLDEEPAPGAEKAPGVDVAKDASKERAALSDKVATLEESIESRALENKKLREKVGKAQENVKNTDRLIELENKSLAEAQKRAAEKAAADKAAEAAKDKKPEATAPAETVKPAEAPKVAEAPKPAEAPKVAPPAAKPAPAPAPVAEEPGFLDDVLQGLFDDPVQLGMVGGGVVLVGGILALYYRRRRQAKTAFAESILSGSGVMSDSSMVSDSGGQAAASDTSFLSDFSQGGMGNIHTDEVDPIAEAEVYLAYGRDEQAEEILKDAVVKDPARQELKGKLLEIYFQRNDVRAFETLAEELYAQVEGKGGKVWEKAEEMGRKLSPGNPMFSGGKPVPRAAMAAASAAVQPLSLDIDTENVVPSSGAAAPTALLDFETPAAAPASGGAGMSLDFAPSAESSGGGLDFSIDMSSPTSAETDAAVDALRHDDKGGGAMPGLDFNFNMGSASEPAPSTIDFNMSVEPEATTEAIDFNMSTTGGMDGGLSFDTASVGGDLDLAIAEPGETPDTGSPAGWDETATKLDLAKAYVDMGDADGARSIINEVLAEGNEQQKKEAQALAAQIG
jgi:pilus assembly protein FimV